MKTIQDFHDLVERCERLAEKNPAAYRWRVAGLALLGLLFVITLAIGGIVLGLGTAALLIASKAAILLKFAIIPLAFSYVILRSLFISLPPPDGLPLTKKAAPKLFAEIDAVRSRIKAQRAHTVLIQPESFNAAIVQIPRLGPFGWNRNYLLLGLPLLETLTPEQFRSVLAHEFGHLSNAQSRFRSSIYRARLLWPKIASAFQAEGKSGFLVRPFFDWYAPYFNAYSYVLARTNEYDADNAAASVAGPATAGAALTAVSARSHYLDQGFWTGMERLSAEVPDPPPNPFSCFLNGARHLSDDEARLGLEAALARKTSISDTHPCLADRLASLKVSLQVVTPVPVSAAEALISDVRQRLISQTDATWSNNLSERWSAAREAAIERAKRIKALRDGSTQRTATSVFEAALAAERLEGAASGLRLANEALALDANHAGALFMRGRIKLESRDESGISDLDHAMAADPAAAIPASNIIANHHLSNRDPARAQPYLDRLDRIQAEQAAARFERATAADEDAYVPHGLEAADLAPFQQAIAQFKWIKRAWLVRKTMRYAPERPFYVVMLKAGTFQKSKINLRAVVDGLPNVDCVVVNRRTRRPLGRTLARVPASQIWPVKKA